MIPSGANRTALECVSILYPAPLFIPFPSLAWQKPRSNLTSTVSGNNFVLSSTPGKHRCLEFYFMYSSRGESALLPLFRDGAGGSAQAQGNRKSFYDVVVSTPRHESDHPVPPPHRGGRKPWSGSITHPPRPVLKTTSPATEDGWPKE